MSPRRTSRRTSRRAFRILDRKRSHGNYLGPLLSFVVFLFVFFFFHTVCEEYQIHVAYSKIVKLMNVRYLSARIYIYIYRLGCTALNACRGQIHWPCEMLCLRAGVSET